MLYPKNTSSRTVINLDGMWEFKLGSGTKEFEENIAKSLITDGRPMPVPSSYNDIYEDIKDYFGWVYYQRKFQVSDALKGKDLVLRFDAVTHWARVNGEEIAKNKGDFLPFEVEIQDKIKNGDNVLIVACSNIINYETLPVGGKSNMLRTLMRADSVDVKGEQTENNPNFDFF